MQHALASDRLQALEAVLAERGSVSVAELARSLGVSEMTIRRDLDKLSLRGDVARVHGGAIAAGPLRFGERLERRGKAKRAAAAKLLPLIPERGALYLDGSTTVFQLVRLLDRHRGLVATNNLDTFRALQALPAVEPVLIGGALNRATDNFVGPFARRCLEGLSFALACCSAYALDARLGPSEPSPEDAEIKALVCQRSRRVALAVDHAKLGTQADGTWDLPAQATLVTDLAPGDARLAPFRPSFTTIL